MKRLSFCYIIYCIGFWSLSVFLLSAVHWVNEQVVHLRQNPVYLLSLDPEIKTDDRLHFETDLRQSTFTHSLTYVSPDDQINEMDALFDLDQSIGGLLQDNRLFISDTSSPSTTNNSFNLPHLYELQLKADVYSERDNILGELAVQKEVFAIQKPQEGNVLPVTYAEIATWSTDLYVYTIAILILLLVIGHILGASLVSRLVNDASTSNPIKPWLAFQWILLAAILFACYSWLFHSMNVINFIYLPVIPVISYALVYSIYFLIRGKGRTNSNAIIK